MRLIFLAFLLGVLLLVCATARSDQEQDSITLTRDQINQLQKEFEQIANKREREAFEAGKRYQAQACRNLI